MRWTCLDCKAAAEAETQRERQQAAQLRASLVQEELDQKRANGLSVSRLSLTDAVYLVSLLRTGGAEDLSFVSPHDSFTALLSPTPDFDREILDHLYRRGIICIHPGSRQESVIIENGAFTKFVPFKVHWILPLSPHGPTPVRFQADVEALLKSRQQWPETWHSELSELHRTVALQECLQYLRVHCCPN